MTDREKVVRGLECIGGYIHMEADPCAECGYNECQTFAICLGEVARDALKLLEPVEPICDHGTVSVSYRCGNCKTHFYLRQQKYCAICGRMAKWNG